MFYWKYLDLDEAIIKSLQDEYYKHLPNNTHFFQQLDLPINEFLGLEVQRFVLIQVLLQQPSPEALL
jgi:hypothetical protein